MLRLYRNQTALWLTQTATKGARRAAPGAARAFFAARRQAGGRVPLNRSYFSPA